MPLEYSMVSEKFEAIKQVLQRHDAQHVLVNWSEKSSLFEAAFENGHDFLHHELTRPWTLSALSAIETCPATARRREDESTPEVCVTASGEIDGFWFDSSSLIELPDGKYSVEVSGSRTYTVKQAEEPERYWDLTATWEIRFVLNPETRRALLVETGEATFECCASDY